MTKREYLCVVSNGGVYRLPLDIGKLRNREKIPPKPKVPPHVPFQKLEVDKSPTVRPGRIPSFMQPILVDDDDHLILAGGWVAHFPKAHPNIDVAYEIVNDRVKPIIPSPLCSINPDLCSWLAKVGETSFPGVCIYQFRSSVYVLDATDPVNLSFRVFDLNTSRQRILPNPPDGIKVLNQTRWGYKFHITGRPNYSLWAQTVAYTFDLLDEKWDRCHIEFRAAVKYCGFLIGIIPSGKLVCCPMDSYGNPNQHTPMRVLHDMFNICMLRDFYFFHAESIFMGLYKDGEDDYIWLVYTLKGPEADLNLDMHFVLFQVSFQSDVLCAVVEASDHYHFRENYLCSAFVYADPAE